MSWNEEEMIREMPIVNLKLDEAVEILVQLKAFNISLYKEILEIKPETKDVELLLKSNLGMVVLNERVFKEISGKIGDLLGESKYCNNLIKMSLTEMIFEATIDRLYHEAKEEIENDI